jgi:hypothetical protein
MAGEKVVLASFLHGLEDTTELTIGWEWHSVAIGMRPLCPPCPTD